MKYLIMEKMKPVELRMVLLRRWCIPNESTR